MLISRLLARWRTVISRTNYGCKSLSRSKKFGVRGDHVDTSNDSYGEKEPRQNWFTKFPHIFLLQHVLKVMLFFHGIWHLFIITSSQHKSRRKESDEGQLEMQLVY